MKQTFFNNIDELIGFIKRKNIFLVCGSSYDKLDFSEKLQDLEITRFSDFSPNPLYEDVCNGVDIFKENNCEIILAIGGGSAMDVAKCIKLFSKMKPNVNYLQQEYKDTEVPLIAIPTTAGTGSESTKHAVIYYEGAKQSVSHESIVPDYVCLAPSVLKNLPLYQKKCTMLDALCQAIESWWSKNATEESIEYSKKAIKLIEENYKAYLKSFSSENAQKMLLASNYAGRAINITATTAPHAMSYKLTSLYKIPHGHAVAICLPQVWKHMISCINNSNSDEYKTLKQTFCDFPITLQRYEELILELGITCPVSENLEKDIEILTGSVNPERLKNNPIELDFNTLKSLYERIVK